MYTTKENHKLSAWTSAGIKGQASYHHHRVTFSQLHFNYF